MIRSTAPYTSDFELTCGHSESRVWIRGCSAFAPRRTVCAATALARLLIRSRGGS